MAAEGRAGSGSVGRVIVIAIVAGALVGGVVGYGAAFLAFRRAQPAQARELWVFTVVLPFDDSRPGFPVRDAFTPDRILVNLGDSVTIHFLNTEEEPENHTFTMDAPYAMDHVVPYGHALNFTFPASAAGVFPYRCRFHQPTMTGTLVVLGG